MDIYLFIGIFLALDLLLVVYILYRRSRKRFGQGDLHFFATEWTKIRHQQDGKHALMDADKLLNVVLRKRGYAGGVGEQLKKAGKLFTSTDDVWNAHKLRNRIAHELGVHLSPADRDRALRSFEKALKDLGAL